MSEKDSSGNNSDLKPLDYQSAKNKRNTSAVPSAIGGTVLGVVTVLGTVPLAFWGSENAHVPYLVGAAVMVAVAFILLWLARSAMTKSLPPEERRRKQTFYVVGLFIGLGIGCLLEGLCFSAISKI